MENFIRLIDIVIWPIIVLIAMVFFKKDLKSIIRRITSVETSNAKLLFQEEIKETEEKMSKLKIIESEESNNWLDEMLKIAELNPRAAIIESWTSIEVACIELGMVQGTVQARFNPRALDNYLKESPKFDNNLINRVMDLRRLRNRAVHGMDADFEYIDAKKYIQIADKALSILKYENNPENSN